MWWFNSESYIHREAQIFWLLSGITLVNKSFVCSVKYLMLCECQTLGYAVVPALTELIDQSWRRKKCCGSTRCGCHSFTHLFLNPFPTFLSSALQLSGSELSGSVFQAQLNFGWLWPKRDTEEKMEGGRTGEAKGFVPLSYSNSIFENSCLSSIAPNSAWWAQLLVSGVPAHMSWICAPLPNSAFSDDMVAWNQPWWDSHSTEIGKQVFLVPRELDVKH